MPFFILQGMGKPMRRWSAVGDWGTERGLQGRGAITPRSHTGTHLGLQPPFPVNSFAGGRGSMGRAPALPSKELRWSCRGICKESGKRQHCFCKRWHIPVHNSSTAPCSMAPKKASCGKTVWKLEFSGDFAKGIAYLWGCLPGFGVTYSDSKRLPWQ